MQTHGMMSDYNINYKYRIWVDWTNPNEKQITDK